MKDSNYTWLIDAGHGGIDPNGHYVTSPNKMFKHPDFEIYEGAINRIIARKVIDLLVEKQINYFQIHRTIEDTSLKARVNFADHLHEELGNCIYISIHSNAGGGRGFEIFTSPGQTKSDKVAQMFFDVYEKHFPNFKMRTDQSDGDDDKEANFYVLRKTDCPAILLENLFFDNIEEAKFLSSENGQNQIALAIVESIMMVEKLKLV